PGEREPAVKTIVSVTPVAVERDSRTFRAAACMARLGYRSIVFEVEPSRNLNGDVPFELLTLGGRQAPAVPAPAPARPAPAAAPAPPRAGSADALAARAPGWLRAVAGPAWRLMLRRANPGRALLRARMRVNRTEPVRFARMLVFYAGTCRAAARELPAADLYY